MRKVKKLPKSAICFGDSGGIGLYTTKKCAYLRLSHVGKFVNGEFVEVPNKKVIFRFSPEELEQFMCDMENVFSFLELLEGKYVNRYIV